MASDKKAVSENLPAAVASAGLPDYLATDLEHVSGLGNSQDMRDQKMPFLAILQKGSPQVNEEESKFIEGARAGMLVNTATGRLYSGKEGEAEVVVIGYRRNFVEWKPNRGGYVNTHEFDARKLKSLGAVRKTTMHEGRERSQIVMPNGNIINDTAYTLVMLERTIMVIGASSTALGPMRDWMSYRNSLYHRDKQLPSFAKKYKLFTVYEKNDAGDWYNWKPVDNGYTDSETYELAKMGAIAFVKGEIDIGRPDDFADDAPSSSGQHDDGIPV